MTEPGRQPPAPGWSAPPPPPGAVPADRVPWGLPAPLEGPPPAPISGGPTGPAHAGPPPPGQQPTRGAYDLEAGVVDVRPLRFTDILDGSFSLFRATLRVMAPLVLAVMVPLQLLSSFLQREALSFGFSGLLDDRAAADVLLGQAGATAGLVLNGVSQLLVVPVLAGALVLVAGRRYLGQPVHLRQILSQTGRKAGWLIVAYLVTGVLRLLPLTLVAAFAVVGSDVGLAISIVVTGVVAVGLTPLFVLVTPAIMLEPLQPVQAFRHAITLVRGAYWRTLGVVVGTTLVFNLLALLLAGIPNVVGFVGFDNDLGFAWVLIALGSVLAQLIVAPLTAAAMVLLHADLRIRQEGMDFDILLHRMRSRAAAA